MVNVEGHQEGALKGYNPKKPGNRCYNLQFAFCDELKAYITGFVRSGNTYTANGAAEMIQEIVAQITCACGTGAGKMDFANGTEYRQQIKTFRLKYIFLAGKIIRMARSVVLKLSKNILIKRPMQKVFPEKTRFYVPICCLYLSKA